MQQASRLYGFSIPMRVPFRGMHGRTGVLIEGPAGWGEFSPLPGDGPAERGRCLDAAIEAAFDGWPRPRRARVPVNVTIPAVDPAQAYELVGATDCRTAKVKVAEPGQAAGDDIARVEAVRDALGPDGALRIDANGAWPPDTAVAMIRALDRFGLEYAEQPCASLAELAEVRRRVDVPIAADESVRNTEDPLRVQVAGAADVLVLKAAPLGGVRAALRIVEACGLPVVVSSALETSVGIAAGVALAAALPELPYACGLGTVSLLASDVVSRPMRPVGGFLPTGRHPVVDPGLLAPYEADPATLDVPLPPERRGVLFT